MSRNRLTQNATFLALPKGLSPSEILQGGDISLPFPPKIRFLAREVQRNCRNAINDAPGDAGALMLRPWQGRARPPGGCRSNTAGREPCRIERHRLHALFPGSAPIPRGPRRARLTRRPGPPPPTLPSHNWCRAGRRHGLVHGLILTERCGSRCARRQLLALQRSAGAGQRPVEQPSSAGASRR